MDRNDFARYVNTKANLSPNSIRHCLSRSYIYLDWLKDKNKTITKTSMEEFICELKEKGRNNNTLNTYIFAFRFIKHYMIDRGIYNGFFEGFSSFKKVIPQVILLSPGEVNKLIYADTTTKSYIGDKILQLQFMLQTFRMFLAYTGCSFDEVNKLKNKYVDLENGRICMKREKTGSIRNLYITEPLISRLRKLIAHRNQEDLVFTNLRGKRVLATDFSKDLRLAAQKAGIKKRVHPHLLRHVYATYLYMATHDIKLVQEVLGHRDIKSTTIYVHIADEMVKEGMMRHPFVQENICPKDVINFIEEAIKKYKLEGDKRFDGLGVREAVHQFTSNLYRAILPDFR